MKALQKKLEQREKTELIAIIQQMLRQEPDLQWLLTTPLPTSGAQEVSLDPEVYRQQVLAAMAAGDQPRQRKRHEVERRLTAINERSLQRGSVMRLLPSSQPGRPDGAVGPVACNTRH